MITADSSGLAERRVALLITRAISYLVYFYLIVVEIILLMGFFLLLFGANPSAGFTQWVYRNLDRVMAPFRGIFTPIELGTNGADVPAVFETSVLFAMIVYGILALAFSALIGWLSGRLQQIESAELEIKRRAAFEEQMALARAAAESTAQRTTPQSAVAHQPTQVPTSPTVPSAPRTSAQPPSSTPPPPPG